MNPYWNASVSDPYILTDKVGNRRQAVSISFVAQVMTPDQLEATHGRSRTCTTLSRYVMERHLGRLLNKDEWVEHIDGDTMNDDLSNLKVVRRTSAQKAWDEKLPDLPYRKGKRSREETEEAPAPTEDRREKPSYPEYYNVSA